MGGSPNNPAHNDNTYTNGNFILGQAPPMGLPTMSFGARLLASINHVVFGAIQGFVGKSQVGTAINVGMMAAQMHEEAKDKATDPENVQSNEPSGQQESPDPGDLDPDDDDKITTEVQERQKPGADGGTSRQVVERQNGETISVTHQVEVDGEVVHQHQNHVGKETGQHRSFPDEWTGTETINKTN